MYEFISILFIIFSVLQIILFFKVWKMTDDVAKIKNQLSPSEKPHVELLTGDKEKIKETLVEMFMTKAQHIAASDSSSSVAKDSYIKQCASDYEAAAKRMGIDDLDLSGKLEGLREKLTELRYLR